MSSRPRYGLFSWLPIALLVFGAALIFNAAPARADDSGFALKDTPGDHLDILLDGKIAARYMYAYDPSTPKTHELTYKPFLHVFDAEGKAPITKGPLGFETHHRGIFIGWQKIGFKGKFYNLWEMRGGDIVQQKFLDQKADADHATFTGLIDWKNKAGDVLLTEERTMTFHRGPAPFRLMIDFSTKLTAPNGDITLDANPEHGGVQYRPADPITRKETTYYLPKENANPRKDLDYPWAGETYTLGDKRYSVVELNHPDNPKKTLFSAYRDYGRFGAMFTAKIKQGESLSVKYRFLIADGPMPDAATIQKDWDQFAGVTTPSPAPVMSVQKGKPM